MTLGQHEGVVASARRTTSGSRPVMLATFDVPVDARAAAFAVEAAVEAGQPLVIVNVVELTIRPMTASWGQEVVIAEDVDDSLRAPAELAHSLAVIVERIRLVSPRPTAALLEFVDERRPGLLVIGPDRRRIGARRLRRTERRIREGAPCLVWASSDAE